MNTSATALTGIPIEYLFSIIGVLVGIIYLDLKREVRTLRKESGERGTAIALITQTVNAICKELKMSISITSKSDDK